MLLTCSITEHRFGRGAYNWLLQASVNWLQHSSAKALWQMTSALRGKKQVEGMDSEEECYLDRLVMTGISEQMKFEQRPE